MAASLRQLIDFRHLLAQAISVGPKERASDLGSWHEGMSIALPSPKETR